VRSRDLALILWALALGCVDGHLPSAAGCSLVLYREPFP
jgi:hypothetical protein